MQQLLALIIKEFIAIWHDKRSRAAILVPPIVQFFIFTFAATLEVKNVSVGIRNNDTGFYSKELIHHIEKTPYITKVQYFNSDSDLERAVDTQKVLVAIYINSSFSKNILRGQQGEILIAGDGRRANAAQIALGYIFEIIDQFNQYAIDEQSFNTDSKLYIQNWYNPNLNYNWFTITGLVGVLSMLTSLSITSLSLAREKEMGTLEQLLVCPLSPLWILLGKTLPALFIGIFEATIMLVLGYTFLNLPITGSLLLLYFGIIVFIFSVVGIGLFISILSSTQQQSIMGVFLVVVPLVITSGFATPVNNMSWFLQYFSLINPLRYFLNIVRGVCLKGMVMNQMISFAIPIFLIGVINFSTALFFFRTKLK